MNEDLRQEVVREQKRIIEKKTVEYELHQEFKTIFWEEKKKEAKDKEEKEKIAFSAERDLAPYKEKIEFNNKYYAWLESLDVD